MSGEQNHKKAVTNETVRHHLCLQMTKLSWDIFFFKPFCYLLRDGRWFFFV